MRVSSQNYFGEIFIMYIRLTFNVSGDFLDAIQALKNISSDKIYFAFDEEYPNYIQFNSNKDFSNEYYDEEYESIFYEFISKNIENFIKMELMVLFYLWRYIFQKMSNVILRF